MFLVTASGPNEKPIAEFTTFGKCAKWLVAAAPALGVKHLQIWQVEIFKRKPNFVQLEAEFEFGD